MQYTTGKTGELKDQLPEKKPGDKNAVHESVDRKINNISFNSSKVLASTSDSVQEFFFPYKKKEDIQVFGELEKKVSRGVDRESLGSGSDGDAEVVELSSLLGLDKKKNAVAGRYSTIDRDTESSDGKRINFPLNLQMISNCQFDQLRRNRAKF